MWHAFLLLLALAHAPARAGDVPEAGPAPSRRKLDPLALEVELLVHLARSEPEDAERYLEAAGRLRRTARRRFTVSAARPGRDLRVREVRVKQAAHTAFTAALVGEARGLAAELYAKEKLRVRAVKARGAAGPAAPIAALLAGAQGELKALRERLKGLRRERGGLGRRKDSPGRTAEAVIDSLERQIERAGRQVKLLEGLEKGLKKLLEEAGALHPLGQEIERLKDPEAFARRAKALEEAVRKEAEKREEIAAGEAAGTQQVRWVLTRSGEEALRVALEERFEAKGRGKRRGKRSLAFFEGDLDFLPAKWPPGLGAAPRGDLRIVEYAGREEVVATLFECWGLRVPITALEYGGRLHVRGVPPAAAARGSAAGEGPQRQPRR